MAYKAVFINDDHIAHSTWQHSYGLHSGGVSYQYVPTHNGIGNPHHGAGGLFTQNPAGSASNASSTNSANSGNTSSSSTNNSSTNSGSASNTNNTGSTSTQAQPNIVNYKRGNPYLMTNDQLRERNTRATLINNYNKNYPSVEQQFQDGAQKATQLVNSGAQFAKSFVREPNYTRFDLSGLSNEELARANERARLENQYNQYYNPPKEDHTKEWIDRAAQGLGLAISAAGVAVQIILAAKNKK